MRFADFITDLKGFHRVVWVLFFGNLVNSIGGFMIRPFLALYLYGQMGATAIRVGQFMGLMALAGLAAGMVSGSLADRFGRRRMMIAGLAAEAVVLLLFSRARTFEQFLVLGILMGTVGPMFWPASSAAIADVTPSERRAQAYGLLRIAVNFGAAIGPLVGAVLVTRAYSLSFLVTAVTTAAYAIAVTMLVPETHPGRFSGSAAGAAPAAPLASSAPSAPSAPASVPPAPAAAAGYGRVMRDTVFVAFLLLAVFLGTSYSQLETTLSIYVTETRRLTATHYGSIMAFNGLLVVLLQLPITRLVDRYRVHRVLGLSAFVYAVGYLGFGLAHSWLGLMAAMAVITLGEMINSPSYTKFVADVSPPELRGRYMAASGLPWGISGVIGPLGGGYVLGLLGGESIWWTAGLLCAVATAGYLALGRQAASRLARAREESVASLA